MGAWTIRAGRGGAYAADWLARGVISIGWDFGGANIAVMGRKQIREAYASAHPSESKQRVAANVGQVYRFAHSMAQDSTVVMYDPAERLYHMEEVAGPCVAAGEPDAVTYTRAVRWGGTAPRDALAPKSRNSLGGIQTIFSVSDAVMDDLESASGGRPACEPAAPEDDAASDEESLAATYDNGIELIKDRVGQLDWEDMERLVAGLLRAMGYCARVMPKGPDGGRDIAAEVKHRKGAMGAPAVRSFIGGLRAGDRGLYVSTGGFTKEARYEADRANVPVRPLDLDSFVRHYVEVYDRADDDTRSILPLTRIWWPA